MTPPRSADEHSQGPQEQERGAALFSFLMLPKLDSVLEKCLKDSFRGEKISYLSFNYKEIMVLEINVKSVEGLIG